MALLAAELDRKWMRLLQERLDKTGGSRQNKTISRRALTKCLFRARHLSRQSRETLSNAYRYRFL